MMHHIWMLAERDQKACLKIFRPNRLPLTYISNFLSKLFHAQNQPLRDPPTNKILLVSFEFEVGLKKSRREDRTMI